MLEGLSKPQITSKVKAWSDEKAQSRYKRDEQYLWKRAATLRFGVR